MTIGPQTTVAEILAALAEAPPEQQPNAWIFHHSIGDDLPASVTLFASNSPLDAADLRAQFERRGVKVTQ